MDQLRIKGYQRIGGRIRSECWLERERSSVWKHRLELSTGDVVGFCYHKAADLRVRQAAHSLPCLSCIRSCSDCCLQQLFARDHRSAFLTALHGVWSLTGHELLRWERPRCLCGSRAVLFGFSGFVLDQIRARRERFLGLDLDSDGFTVFALSALHYLCTLYSAFLAWGGAQQFLLVWFAATRSKVREQRGSVQQRCMQQSPYFQIIVLEYVDDVLVAFPAVDERIS